MNEKLKAKLEELKAAARKNAPVIITGATAVMGTVGWIVAGVYAQKVKELETVDPNAWPVIEITPNVMKDVREGATMQLRMFHFTDEGHPHTAIQMTTREDGFPAEADESYAKGIPGEGPRI